MRFWLLALFMTVAPRILPAQEIPEVPEHFQFCDLELTLNSGARKYIESFLVKLHRSPTYFASLVDKANTYLPIVEEAFRTEQMPDDLKYMVIQESAFKGDAVSKSGAVGYWQMKEASAREVGLVINRQIDERKHIYRSSVGAARYLFRINRDFDNWLYAVIGYNRGPVGALSFVDKRYYGKKKMLVTGNTHWYALKAIAYKIAFQDEIKRKPATVSLKGYASGGESNVAALAKLRKTDVGTLKQYNPWILGSRLPEGQNMIYYLPGKGKGIIAQADPEPVVKPKIPDPPAAPKEDARYIYLSRETDPDYGKYYAVLKKGEQLPEVAVRTRNKTQNLREYNAFKLSDRLPEGTFVMLKLAKKMRFHIVRPGDTWQVIAGKYGLDYKKLMKQNRARELGGTLQPGQKIYLKGKKPKGEKIIILRTASPKVARPSKQDLQEKGAGKPPKKPTKGKVHVVQSGETLWRISQRYNITVDQIKTWNKLGDNEIYPGQKLKVGK